MIGIVICALIDEDTYGSQVLLSLNAYFLCSCGSETPTLFDELAVLED